jgi:hypothetical protein
MKVQRASYSIQTARLNSEFGEQMAARWFKPEHLALVPRPSRGKNKGKMQGVIEWKKVEVGGWQRDKNSLGGVQYPGTRDVTILWTSRTGGMTRQHRMESCGRVEDQITSDERHAAAIAEQRAEFEAHAS